MTDNQFVKFGDICREVKVSTHDPIGDGLERYVGLEHLDSESINIRRWGVISENNPKFTRVFRSGNILIGKRRPYLKKAALANFDGICSGDIIVIEPVGNEIPSGLLPYIVQSSQFWAWAVKTSSGSLSPRTKFKSLAEFRFEKRSESEYESKLSILEKAEAARQKYFEAINSFSKLSNLLIDRIFEEKNSKEVPFQKLIESGDILEIQDGNHGNDHPKSSEYVNDGVPFVMASDLTSGRIDLVNCKKLPKSRTDKLRTGFSKSGDVLLSHKGTVGLVSVTPETDDYVMLTPQVTYYRLNKKGCISPRYLEIFLRSTRFQKKLKSLAAQSTRAYIGITSQKRLRIPVASKEQQKEIEELWDTIESTKSELARSDDCIRIISNCITDR